MASKGTAPAACPATQSVTTTTAPTTTTTPSGDGVAPTVPSGVVASTGSCSRIDVRWNGSTDVGGSGLKGYALYRNGSFVKQVMAPATSTSDTALGASTTYSYQVSAMDNAGNESTRSAPVNSATSACSTTTTGASTSTTTSTSTRPTTTSTTSSTS